MLPVLLTALVVFVCHAIFFVSIPRVSQNFWQAYFLLVRGYNLSLSCERFGTAFGHKSRLYAGDQRLALVFFLLCFYFGFRKLLRPCRSGLTLSVFIDGSCGKRRGWSWVE